MVQYIASSSTPRKLLVVVNKSGKDGDQNGCSEVSKLMYIHSSSEDEEGESNDTTIC